MFILAWVNYRVMICQKIICGNVIQDDSTIRKNPFQEIILRHQATLNSDGSVWPAKGIPTITHMNPSTFDDPISSVSSIGKGWVFLSLKSDQSDGSPPGALPAPAAPPAPGRARCTTAVTAWAEMGPDTAGKWRVKRLIENSFIDIHGWSLYHFWEWQQKTCSPISPWDFVINIHISDDLFHLFFLLYKHLSTSTTSFLLILTLGLWLIARRQQHLIQQAFQLRSVRWVRWPVAYNLWHQGT